MAHRLLRRKAQLKAEITEAPSEIERDMVARGDTIKFDLSDDKWIQNPEKFWAEFQHTGQVLVPKDFEKWLIGQDSMKEEFLLNLEEHVRKMQYIQRMEDSGEIDDKESMKKFLREWPGPYLLYIGAPGTGKSLLIKIANQKLKELYKKYGITLNDTLLIPNKMDAQRPKVKIVPAGMGKQIVAAATHYGKGKNIKSHVIKMFLWFIVLIGLLLVMTALMLMAYINITLDPELAWFSGSSVWLQWLFYGMFLMVFPLFVLWAAGRMGGLGGMKGNDLPNLIIDNSGDPDLFVDMTVGNASQLFGAVQHDPLQSGGMGTSTHQRMQAGAVHKAHKKIYFLDEIKTFLRNESMVIEFLTVLENGSYPLKGRAWLGAEGNASLAGETDTPLPCQFFLVAAGNEDAMPLLSAYPALRDRFYYGNIKRADDEIPDTPENEIKLVQFVTDEAYRFHVPPLCKEAIQVIINHAKRRASSAKKLKIQMRGYIQDIKKGGQLVWLKKSIDPCPCGLEGEFIHGEHVILSIEQYAKPWEMQELDAHIEKRRPYMLTRVRGKRVGIVNGLVVVGGAGTGTGDVVSVSAYMRKLKTPGKGSIDENFIVTGAPTESKDTWMGNSIQTVRTTILRLYGIDIVLDYYVQIAFLQTDPRSMDGPSAGITMTLALMSILGDPRLPEEARKPLAMRLDIPITGTVENVAADVVTTLDGPVAAWSSDDGLREDVLVGPIGGVFEKAYGARKHGASAIIIPDENYESNYFSSLLFKKLNVLHSNSVLGFFDLLRGDRP